MAGGKECWSRAVYEREGIPVNGETWADIEAAAKETGVDVSEYGWL